MAQTRLPYCAPTRLLSGVLTVPSSCAGRIHRAYARFVWRSAGLRHVALIALMAVLWPATFIVMGLMFTRRLGPVVARRTGKSVLRQVGEQLRLAAVHSIPPDKYYVFELFRDDRRALAADYVMRYELKGAFHNLMHLRAWGEDPDCGYIKLDLTDKLRFARKCRAAGVDTPEVFGRIERAGSGWHLVGESRAGLPQRDLFIKPAKGKGGRGCERWRHVAGGYLGPHGDILTEDALTAHLARRADRRGRYLIQECLVNHPDLAGLSHGLSSLRITSCRNERGGFEVTNATLKFSFASGCSVDNFHRGGGVARVAIDSGIVGPASDSWSRRPCLWHRIHPVTGAPIEGRRLPLWPETVALVERAHALFPDRVMLGFDVAITDRGPVIIEGNVQSGCDMIQRTHDLPVGRQRLGELLAFHADHAISLPLRRKPMAWFGPLDFLRRR